MTLHDKASLRLNETKKTLCITIILQAHLAYCGEVIFGKAETSVNLWGLVEQDFSYGGPFPSPNRHYRAMKEQNTTYNTD